MFDIKKISSFLSICLMSTEALCSLNAHFSQNEVAYGSPVMLIFESDDEIQSLPDLSIIEKDFKIQSKSQSSNVSIINGVMTKKNQISYQLFPLKKGDITLENLEINGEKIAPLSLKVLDKPLPTEEHVTQEITVDFKTELLTPEIFEGEVTIYKAQIKDATQLNDAKINIPKINGLTFSPLDADKISQTIQNGKQIRTFERYFALTPKITGTFDIPPAELSGYIIDTSKKQNREFMGDFFNFPFDFNIHSNIMTPIYFPSNEVQISIHQKPNGWQGWWFPTQQATLTEEYILPNKIKVGDVIERKITLKAQNVELAKLPLIEHPESDDFSLFSNQENRFVEFKDNKIISVENRSFVLSPKKEGKLIIPSFQVEYFNSQTKEKSYISLPEKEIFVYPSTQIQLQKNNINQQPPQNNDVQQNDNRTQKNEGVIHTFYLIISIFILIFACTIGIMFLKLRKKTSSKIEPIGEVQKPISKKRKKKPLPDLYLD